MTVLTRAVELLAEVRDALGDPTTDREVLARLGRQAADLLHEHEEWQRGENTLRWRHYGDELYCQVVHERPGECRWEVRSLSLSRPIVRPLGKGEKGTEEAAKKAALEFARRYSGRSK